jgi:hypothetical protein
MTNVQIPEGTKLLAWIAITWLAMRSFSICTFVFLSFNMNVFRVAAIHVQSGGAGTPLSGRCRDARPRSRGQDDEAATPVQNSNGKSISRTNRQHFKLKGPLKSPPIPAHPKPHPPQDHHPTPHPILRTPHLLHPPIPQHHRDLPNNKPHPPPSSNSTKTSSHPTPTPYKSSNKPWHHTKILFARRRR